jgi:hypothetical protein
LVDYGPLVLFAAAAGITAALDVLKRDGTTAAHLDQLMTFGDFNRLTRIDEVVSRSDAYTRE